MNTDESEQYETIEELSHLFIVVQAIRSRLANETHGPSYDLAQEMNEFLHLARVKMEAIHAETFGGSGALTDRRSAGRRATDLRVI